MNAVQLVEGLALDEQWLVKVDEVILDYNLLIGSESYGGILQDSYCGVCLAVKVPRTQNNPGIDVTARSIPALTDKFARWPQSSTWERRIVIWCLYGSCLSLIALVLEFDDGQRLNSFIRGRCNRMCLLRIPPTDNARVKNHIRTIPRITVSLFASGRYYAWRLKAGEHSGRDNWPLFSWSRV